MNQGRILHIVAIYKCGCCKTEYDLLLLYLAECMGIYRTPEFVTRFYKTDPNRTSGKIKLTSPVDSYTIVLVVLTLSTTQTT